MPSNVDFQSCSFKALVSNYIIAHGLQSPHRATMVKNFKRLGVTDAAVPSPRGGLVGLVPTNKVPNPIIEI